MPRICKAPGICRLAERRARCRSEVGSVAAGDGEILSFCVWESRADAEAGSAAAAEWVSQNMLDDIELIGVRYAEVLFSTSLGISTSVGSAA